MKTGIKLLVQFTAFFIEQLICYFNETQTKTVKRMDHAMHLDHSVANFEIMKNIEMEEEIIQLLSNEKLSVVISFNSIYDYRYVPTIKKLFKRLAEETRLTNLSTMFYFVDISRVPSASGYLRARGLSFCLIIKRRLRIWDEFRFLVRKMPNFKAFHSLIFRLSLDFISEQLNRIPNPLNSMQQIEEILKKKPLIILYLGKNDADFRRFEEFAINRMDAWYFYSFDAELNQRIFHKYRGTTKPLGNCFAYLRNDEATNEFDIYQLEFTLYKSNYNEKNWQKNYSLKKYPKLRNETHVESVIENARAGYTVVLYLASEYLDLRNYKEFTSAVQRLKKKLVFCKMSITSEAFDIFTDQLGLQEYDFAAENLYLIFYGQSDGFSVVPFEERMNYLNIVFFVQSSKAKNEVTLSTEIKNEQGKNKFDNIIGKLFSSKAPRLLKVLLKLILALFIH